MTFLTPPAAHALFDRPPQLSKKGSIVCRLCMTRSDISLAGLCSQVHTAYSHQKYNRQKAVKCIAWHTLITASCKGTACAATVAAQA